MTKYYKNLKTGAVITEKEYQEKLKSEVLEENMDTASMSMGGASSFITEAMEGTLNDYSEYVPFEPNE